MQSPPELSPLIRVADADKLPQAEIIGIISRTDCDVFTAARVWFVIPR